MTKAKASHCPNCSEDLKRVYFRRSVAPKTYVPVGMFCIECGYFKADWEKEL